jgi:hypothetical protein
MTSEQLLENFKTQQTEVMNEIRQLDEELSKKKELYVKLQGAIEGLELLATKEEDDVQMVAEALS